MEDKQEWIAFEKTFDKIVEGIAKNNTYPEVVKVVNWVKTIMISNVPHGKRNRGLSVVTTFKLLFERNTETDWEENLELARILGWCVEMLQSYFLIIDDIMDGSVKRRGQLCWYKRKDVGLNACNDAILLLEEIYSLLKSNFQNKPNYVKIVELFHEITKLTSYGQCLDTMSNPPDGKPQLETFTFERYSSIVKFKTAFYTFVLPVKLAMYLANWNDPEGHKLCEVILLKIGHLFQQQDDYLDCFGDIEVIGKVGVDIEEGKCCWPIVTALTICDEKQNSVLEECYGIKSADCVKRVKDVYNNLNLVDIYRKQEESQYNEICALIDELKNKTNFNTLIIHDILNKIYKRDK